MDALVLEMTLPVGSAPPLHVHDDLDDTRYILDGQMVVRCGEDELVAFFNFGNEGSHHDFALMELSCRAPSRDGDSTGGAQRRRGLPAPPLLMYPRDGKYFLEDGNHRYEWVHRD